MTCLTCHDPHLSEKPKEGAETTAFYREKCLNCHSTQGCRLDKTERLKKGADDNCMACHMPRGDTDIPHVAFTHHRIGLHGSKPPRRDDKEVPKLVAIGDESRLTLADQKRNLGLAYLEAARNQEYRAYAGNFAFQARSLLEAVRTAGLREGETAAALADLYFQADSALSRTYAREAVEAQDTPVEARVNAMIHLATCEMEDHNYTSAIALLKELVRLRRSSEDWGLLGMCYSFQGQLDEALTALQTALAIRPDSYPIHVGLEKVYKQKGDLIKAKEHQEKAQWLQRHAK
jgi:tetratricopeptide (TPR) repeat protein